MKIPILVIVQILVQRLDHQSCYDLNQSHYIVLGFG